MRRRIALGLAAAALAAVGFFLATRGGDDDGSEVAPTPTSSMTGTTSAATDTTPPPVTIEVGDQVLTVDDRVTTRAQRTTRPFHVGVWEYFLRDPRSGGAARKVRDAKASGFEAVLTTSLWAPGRRSPSAVELRELRNAATAARAAGVRPLLIVTNFGSRTTPGTPQFRSEFASYAASIARQIPEFRDFVIGNEPNLNRFWLPQFTANGTNAAAPAYLALLAETYDALKEVSSEIRVIGGALAPRGGDDPSSLRHTHSPTKFILDLGKAYRETGRDRPVMDALAHHPYLESSRLSPSFAHPRSTTIALADYGKLVAVLAQAFDGTDQPGSKLPILYTEFGVQTRIPPSKRGVYKNHSSPVAPDAVSEATQASYYREAFAIAYCQPTVEGLFIFHVWDEPDLFGWQSGLYYADHSPKSSRNALHGWIRSCA